MDRRLAHRVTIIGAETQSAQELRATLQRREGPLRFTVALKSCLRGLGPCRCELLIIDVDGHASQGLELLARFRGLYPYLPVIMLVGCGDTSLAVAAMKAGAVDCLEKPLEAGRLLDAVTAALGNGQPSGCGVHRALTSTEDRVLRLLLAGRTNLEVAEQFHRSRRTIEVHRMNIMRKLGVSCVADLVREALRIGLIGKSEHEEWLSV
jgi:two-component system response regulator FixJ